MITTERVLELFKQYAKRGTITEFDYDERENVMVDSLVINENMCLNIVLDLLVEEKNKKIQSKND